LDDEVWEIRYNFPGQDNLERTLSRSDITVLNMLALLEGHGYGIRDYMYYIEEKGKGKKGMEIIDSMQKIEEMLELYDSVKVLNIKVIKHKSAWPVGLNIEEDGGNAVIEELVVLSVDDKGVTYISEDDEDKADLVPVAIDYTDVLFIGTHQSCNMKKKGKRSNCCG
jgi:hypothetical protein